MTIQRDEQGFTLVEMLSVIAIMAIVITFAFIQTRSVVDRQNVEKLIKAVHTDLMSARMRAMQRNRQHFVFVNVARNYVAVFEDTFPAPDGNGTLEPGLGQDTVVTSENLLPNYPTVWDFVNPFSIRDKGLVDEADLPVTVGGVHRGTFRVVIPSAESGSVDCLVITQVKVTMGRWVGAECIPQ